MAGLNFSGKFIFFKNLKKNSTGIYWLLILGLLVMEFFVVRGSAAMVFGSKKDTLPTQGAGVRINFTDYQAIVQRLQRAEDYRPTAQIRENPFNHSATPVEIPRQ